MSHEPKPNIEFGSEEWVAQMSRFEKKSLINLYAEASLRIIDLEGQLGYVKGLNTDLIQRNTRLRDIIGDNY